MYYSPVRHSSASEDLLPFDLHVLGMPPAFNLSQDQTLQFDLEFKVLRLTHKTGIEVNFTSHFHERLFLVLKELGNSPSNAHAYRLYLVKDALQNLFRNPGSLRSAKPCIVALIS